MKKVAVLLSGCGVYDGSEIHEAVFSLLAISQNGLSYQCFAPNKAQLHVVNHVNGEVVEESRNVLEESARIARGDIQDLKSLNLKDFDALVIPGGFGAAKNLNQWAMHGPSGEIDADVKNQIQAFVAANKPILALCMGPTVVAKALENTEYHPKLTVGTVSEESPYDIKGISDGMESIGSVVEMKSIKEFAIDEDLNILSAPCYMMEGSIAEVHDNIQMAVKALKSRLA